MTERHLTAVPDVDPDETISMSLHRRVCAVKDARIAYLEWLLDGRGVRR